MSYQVDECPDCGNAKMESVQRCRKCTIIHREEQTHRHPNPNRVCPDCGYQKSWQATFCATCSIGRRTMAKKAAAVAAGLAFGFVLVSGAGGVAPAFAAKQSTEDKLRAQIISERNKHDITKLKLKRQVAATRKAKKASTPAKREAVAEAKLAVTTMARIFGVPDKVAHRMAKCESTWRPWATNGQYVGVFQLGRNFYPGPFLSSKSDAFHPWLNAAAAMKVVAVQGDRQWECSGLTGRGKPNYPSNSAGWRP